MNQPFGPPGYPPPPPGGGGYPPQPPGGGYPPGPPAPNPYAQPAPSPYGAPPGGPLAYNPYGAPGGAPMTREHPRATLVLVLGIISWLACGLLTGIPAWVMGASALKEMRANPGVYSGEQNLKIGMWAGAICTVFTGLATLGAIAIGIIGAIMN